MQVGDVNHIKFGLIIGMMIVVWLTSFFDLFQIVNEQDSTIELDLQTQFRNYNLAAQKRESGSNPTISAYLLAQCEFRNL